MNYAWGSRSALSELLARDPSGAPEAEFWMGAHPKAPSLVETSDGPIPLDAFVAAAPAERLGFAIAERFGRLPFLFKILAAAEPLSIQLHPSLAQARAEFGRTQGTGLFHDGSHKPELVCALTPFEALSGFRTPSEVRAALATVGMDRPEHPLFDAFVSYFNEGDSNGTSRFVAALLRAPRATVRRAIDFSVEVAALGASSESSSLAPERLFLELAQHYADDPGVFVALCLNPVRLAPGEAIYLPPTVLHAYLRGTALEVMAASDNVLRAGLTKKDIHVEAVLSHADFEVHRPRLLEGESFVSESETRRVYGTEAPEFELTRLELRGRSGEVRGPSIVLGLLGNVRVRQGNTEVSLARGENLFVEAGEFEFVGEGSVAFVTVNPKA